MSRVVILWDGGVEDVLDFEAPELAEAFIHGAQYAASKVSADSFSVSTWEDFEVGEPTAEQLAEAEALLARRTLEKA